MRIGLVVDATCDLPPEFLSANNIRVLPIGIRVGQRRIIDDRDPDTTLRFYAEELPKVAPEDGSEPPNLRVAMTCNNMEALRGAVVAGFGIGFMPEFLVHDALACGSLVTVLDAHPITPGQFSILWPSSRHLSPKLRVFVDFMCEQLFPEA